jgi:hypothetical protein
MKVAPFTDRLLPKRTTARKEILLPVWRAPQKLIFAPKRAEERSDKLDESSVLPTTDILQVDPTAQSPNKLTEEPNLVKLRSDIDDAKFAVIAADNFEPNLPKLLTDKEDEIIILWHIDRSPPALKLPSIENPDPILNEERIEIELPNINEFMTLIFEPKRV